MPEKKSYDEKEIRCFDAAELRITKSEDDKPVIEGYAAVFNKLSENLGGWREKIAPGAFKNTIKKDDIRALIDHNSSLILGRNKAGTLSLAEDDKGLRVNVTPPETNAGKDILESIERGDVTGMSFGFKTITDSWETIDEVEIRILKEVKLYDVSPVTFPAYPDTSVGVRSFEQHKEEAIDHKTKMKMQLQLIEADM